MTIKYPENINIKCDTQNLNNTNILQRTYLTAKLPSNTGKIVSVILMNPSKANSTQSDNTVNKVINYFNNRQYTSINILNLFPIYASNSNNLYNSLQSVNNLQNIINTNLDMISNHIRNSTEIVLAWGDCPKNFNATLYYNTIYNVLKLLVDKENIYCFKYKIPEKLSKYKNPFHPSRKGPIVGLNTLILDPNFLTLS